MSGQVTIGFPGVNASIDCPATPVFTPPTASSVCSGVTVNEVSSTTSGNSCTKVITKSWDATDDCGNTSATVSQTITVSDRTPPTIGLTGPNATIGCGSTPLFTVPTASDGCSGPTVNLLSSVTTGSACSSFTITDTWDATDACGFHSVTRSQSITVLGSPPTIGPAGSNATLECTATPVFTPPTASNACGAVMINLLSNITAGDMCTRTFIREWDATDACGNHTATRSQTITVVDNTSPTIGPPGPNATISCGSQPVFTPPTASDNCSAVDVSEATSTAGAGCFQTITKRWFALDACGHSSDTVSQSITIRSIVGGQLLIKVPSDFLNLSEAVQYLDTTGITLPTVIELEPGYTSFIPVVIGHIPGSDPTNTLTIRPAVNATGLVIGSPKPFFDPNSLTFFLPPPTLVTMDLQNASNVIIDGRPGGMGTQSQLSIQNFSVAGNAVRFVYGANNNCIKYCSLEGVNVPSAYTNSPAVVLFDSTGSKSNPVLQNAINTKDTLLNCMIRGIGDSIPVYNGIY